jgi:hypothetical protein
MIPWRVVSAALLVVAAIGAIVQSANASDVGRLAAGFAALVMAGVAYGVLRRQSWAFGSVFLLGICWFWAAVALTAQGSFSAAELFVWLAWSIVMVVASVRMRAAG